MEPISRKFSNESITFEVDFYSPEFLLLNRY